MEGLRITGSEVRWSVNSSSLFIGLFWLLRVFVCRVGFLWLHWAEATLAAVLGLLIVVAPLVEGHGLLKHSRFSSCSTQELSSCGSWTLEHWPCSLWCSSLLAPWHTDLPRPGANPGQTLIHYTTRRSLVAPFIKFMIHKQISFYLLWASISTSVNCKWQ